MSTNKPWTRQKLAQMFYRVNVRKNDSKFDIGIETLSLLVHQLGTVLKMAEICPRYYLEYLTALKEKMLEVAKT